MNSNHRYFNMLQASLVAEPAVVATLDARRQQNRLEREQVLKEYESKMDLGWKAVWRDSGVVAGGLIVLYVLACRYYPGSRLEDLSGFLLPFLPVTTWLYRSCRILDKLPYPKIVDEYRLEEPWFTVCPAGSPARQHVDELCERHVECKTYRDAVLALGRDLRVADINYIEELAIVLQRGDVPEPSDWPQAQQA